MAKYKVRWSSEARLDLIDILQFYNERNGNNRYSRSLYSRLIKSIRLISKNPYLGVKTEIKTIRALVTGNYHIIYEISGSEIVIVIIWDCRRDPGDKIISHLRIK